MLEIEELERNPPGMKTALIYDKIASGGKKSWVDAEYETPETINVLLKAIQAHSDEAVSIAFGPGLVDQLIDQDPDLAFNIAEGHSGPCRESIVPSVLEYLNIPYTGSDGVTLGISLNKALTKRLATAIGIRTPRFYLFKSSQEVAKLDKEVGFPLLLKPNFGGSQIGIEPACLVHDWKSLSTSVSDYILRYGQPCLAEEHIEGTDFTIGLLGNSPVEVLPAGKIITQKGKRKIVCPFSLPRSLERQLRSSSVKIYELIGARDLARLDYILDKKGQLYFLEINPLPGLSPYYGIMPVLAQAAGYQFKELTGRIIEVALERLRKGTRV